MNFTRDRAEFMRQMRAEFTAQGETTEIPDPPRPEQMRRLFRFLRGRAQEAVDAYVSYAGIFYIHRGHTPNPGDVEYPGGAGDTCDSWSEIMDTGMQDSMHVIDCEAYAYMGAILLREAGFRFIRYIDVVSRDWFGDNHVIAEMRTPGAAAQTIFVSNDWIYDTLRSAVESVGFDMQNVRYGYGQTVHGASEEAYWIKVRWRLERTGDALLRASEVVARSQRQMRHLEPLLP